MKLATRKAQYKTETFYLLDGYELSSIISDVVNTTTTIVLQKVPDEIIQLPEVSPTATKQIGYPFFL
jgi:hypothetical protein